MTIVCPTITAENAHTYREQLERVEPFASHVHLDVMDGKFTDNTSIDASRLWLPEDMTCDVHAMYERPSEVISDMTSLSLRTFIVPVECDDDLKQLADAVHARGAKFGVALLHDTGVDAVSEQLDYVDHVLLFSGNLGHQGGSIADLKILNKVDELKKLKSSLEIGWDGGVTDKNCPEIVASGVDVINAGGFIHFASDPAAAYRSLVDAAHVN